MTMAAIRATPTRLSDPMRMSGTVVSGVGGGTTSTTVIDVEVESDGCIRRFYQSCDAMVPTVLSDLT